MFGAVGQRIVSDTATRAAVSLWLRLGAVLMPLGFFLGGVLNHEGDPSLAILLVPLGGVILLYALVRAGLAALRS